MDSEEIADQASRAGKFQDDGTTVTVLRFPADGSIPQLVELKTFITFKGIHKIYQLDFREYWGVPWSIHAHFTNIELSGQTDRNFDGTWRFTRYLEGKSLPPNQAFPGAFGDVFMVKVNGPWSGADEAFRNGNVPEDWEQCYGLQKALCELASNKDAWWR